MRRLCALLVLALLLTGCNQTGDGMSATNSDQALQNPWVCFDIFAVNDLHGKIADSDTQPGVDELSTYLTQPQWQNTIVLSTGDMWQGASASNLTNGRIVTEWMNRMGFAAMVMGGHEFDWGEEWIRQNDRLAEFPFLGINIFSRATEQRVDYCQSSVVVEKEGVQIGIIGAIGDCYGSIASQQTENIYFKTGDELTELVKKEAQSLRSRGVDFIIYAIHDGYDKTTSHTTALPVETGDLRHYYDTVLSDGYVDLVFEADTHYEYVLIDPQGVYHLQAGGNNTAISHGKVLIHKTTGESSVVTAELLPNSKYSHAEDHPAVAELMEKYEQQIQPASKVVGNNSRYRAGHEICQLVADLYCDKGVQRWADRYDIVLGGGYLSCRSPGYLEEGPVTYSQLLSLLPFDNQITLCSIQGRDLISKFLETDHSAYYIKTTAYGESIRHSIDPDATYYVVTDSYSANYVYNRMTVVEVYSPDIFARDLVAEYIAQGTA